MLTSSESNMRAILSYIDKPLSKFALSVLYNTCLDNGIVTSRKLGLRLTYLEMAQTQFVALGGISILAGSVLLREGDELACMLLEIACSSGTVPWTSAIE